MLNDNDNGYSGDIVSWIDLSFVPITRPFLIFPTGNLVFSKADINAIKHVSNKFPSWSKQYKSTIKYHKTFVSSSSTYKSSKFWTRLHLMIIH